MVVASKVNRCLAFRNKPYIETRINIQSSLFSSPCCCAIFATVLLYNNLIRVDDLWFFLCNGLTRDLRLSISNSAPFFLLLKQKSKWNKPSFQHTDSKYEIEKRERLQQGWVVFKVNWNVGEEAAERVSCMCVCVYREKCISDAARAERKSE